jgi:hypothetical protein
MNGAGEGGMNDIVTRIRMRHMPAGGTFELLDEAADEIERLRTAMKAAIVDIEVADEIERLTTAMKAAIDDIEEYGGGACSIIKRALGEEERR